MSFAETFRRRWEEVLAPGIADIQLKPFRIDIPKGSASIPTDIVIGIAESRLVLADITSVDGHRNGNVMYEVGIAHAARQPEEVLLFRSDTEPLLFDVATVRVNTYDPDNDPRNARAIVAATIRAALLEIDASKALAVRQAVEALSWTEFEILMDATDPEGVSNPKLATVRDAVAGTRTVSAISRLLELGLLRTNWRINIDPEQLGDSPAQAVAERVKYTLTRFGTEVGTEIFRLWNTEPQQRA